MLSDEGFRSDTLEDVPGGVEESYTTEEETEKTESSSEEMSLDAGVDHGQSDTTEDQSEKSE